jgi:membrane protein implicated in regulation of membrane protease activity
MFAVPDGLAAFYLGCFLIGLVFVVTSALLGFSQHAIHLPGLHHDFNIGADTHAGAGHVDVGTHAGHTDIGGSHQIEGGAEHAGSTGHADADGARASSAIAPVSPFNLMTIMAFLTWFGATGYILHAIYGVFPPLTVIGALASGGVVGWLVFLFLAKVLIPGTVWREANEKLVGRMAKVTIAVPEGGTGEIVYTISGSRHSDGARSLDGQPIPRGTEVVIVEYKKGLAYIQPWSSFLEPGANAEPWRRFLDAELSDDDRPT